MVKIVALAFAGLALAGCASAADPAPLPRYYVDYKAVLVEQVDHAFTGGPNAAAPGPVKMAYESCSADYALSGFTANERARLDAYARREVVLTRGELQDLDNRLRARLGPDLTMATIDRLSPICPNDVPKFREYFRS